MYFTWNNCSTTYVYKPIIIDIEAIIIIYFAIYIKKYIKIKVPFYVYKYYYK